MPDRINFKPTENEITLALVVIEWARQDAVNELTPQRADAETRKDYKAMRSIEYLLSLVEVATFKCGTIIEQAADRQGVTS